MWRGRGTSQGQSQGPRQPQGTRPPARPPAPPLHTGAVPRATPSGQAADACLRAFALAGPTSRAVLLSQDISAASLLLPACPGAHVFLEGRLSEASLTSRQLCLPPWLFLPEVFPCCLQYYMCTYLFVRGEWRSLGGGGGSDLVAEGEGEVRTPWVYDVRNGVGVEPFALTGNWGDTSLTSGWFPRAGNAPIIPCSSRPVPRACLALRLTSLILWLAQLTCSPTSGILRFPLWVN